MTSPSDNDKNKDAASDAKASGGEPKADKFASAKETLNKIINKTRVLAGKAFAVAKATTKDVVQELRNVNGIRKETVATAAEGTKKTDMAKAFWTKTSGKQRGIVLLLSALILFFSYSVFFKKDSPRTPQNTATPPAQTPIPAPSAIREFSYAEGTQHCSKVTGISKGFAEGVADRLNVSVSSIKFLRPHVSSVGCGVVVDTAKGPKTCDMGPTVITNGAEFWIGGICIGVH